MKIVNPENKRENWHDVLSSWSRVVNWVHYKYTDPQLQEQIKPLIIYLWNEKDWVKKRYPKKAREVEEYVNNSKYIKIIADLANSIKHGGLDNKARSTVQQTDYFGESIIECVPRSKYYLQIGPDERLVEIFEVLKGAIVEYENLENQCRH